MNNGKLIGWTGALLAVAVTGIVLLHNRDAEVGFRAWYGLGVIQVLGGEDEAWIFLEKNIVTKWEWSGNNCPFADVLEYSNWERKSPSERR